MSASDKDTLHILAIFHYIIAGIIAIVACVPLIHLAMGLTMAVGGIAENVPALGFMGVMFSLVAILVILVGLGLAIFIFIAGRNLDRQTKYQVCLFGAGVLCIFIPIGTILGVFTMVTLQSDSVRVLFNGKKTAVSGGSADSVADSEF